MSTPSLAVHDFDGASLDTEAAHITAHHHQLDGSARALAGVLRTLTEAIGHEVTTAPDPGSCVPVRHGRVDRVDWHADVALIDGRTYLAGDLLAAFAGRTVTVHPLPPYEQRDRDRRACPRTARDA